MLIFDVMSYKSKFTFAVIASFFTVLLAFSAVPVMPVLMEDGAPLWLIVLPLVVTIIFAAVSGWLWKKAREGHAPPSGSCTRGGAGYPVARRTRR